MKKALLIVLFIFSVLIIINGQAYSQSLPAITYATPQVYTVGSVITPLSPTNPGGTVFPASYNTPTTFTAYNTPYSIAIDGSDNVYTTNNSTGYLTKFNSSGTVLFTINTGDIQGSEIAVDGLGNIYVSQFTANSVLKYNPAGKLLAAITGFSDPYGIAFDASNNAYIANYFSGNIIKIDTGAKTSIYLTGLNKPYGITIDAAGNMYVGEQGPGDIIKFAAGTLAKSVFATGFNNPRHLSKDRFGNIFVADYGNNAIKGITPTGVVSTILSTGLSSPRQAAFNSSGSLFIANYGTNTLLKAVPTNYFKSFSINAPLPAGLNFSTSIGQITGTPTTPAPLKTYAVTATYTSGATSSAPVTITVNLPNNAALSALSLSSGSLSPVFSSGITSYTASVTNDINSITVTPTLSDPTATVTVNGIKVTSGSASTYLPLNVGNNTITTIVTAQDGTTKQSYAVTVTRAALSNAALSKLTLSSGSLSPAFSNGIVNYTANVANNVNTITLTPIAIDPTATVTVNGITAASGTALLSPTLNIGGNTIIVKASTQGGAATQSYSVTIFRAGSSNAVLNGLSLSSGSLSPAFSSTTGSYTAKVPYNTTSITVTPTAIDSTVTIAVNDTTVASGIASNSIPLNLGNNTITTTVTAQDGMTTQSYTVVVSRVLSSNAALASLAISSGRFSAPFNSNTSNYTINVSNSVSSIIITPTTSDPTATVTVNGVAVLSGMASSILPLNVGSNTITTVVTAQDGTTTQSYTITVNRTASSIATLSNLIVGGGSLSTQFLSGTTSYTVNVSNSVTNFTVSPTIADPTATVTVNGIVLVAGSMSASFALRVGSNTITTVVTAQDKTTKVTYVVNVIRAPSSNAGLANLILSNGSLSPVFATATTGYTTNISNAITSITVTPTTSDATATLTINGATVASGTSSALINLKVGSNTITTVVTAQDKITKSTYTVTVIRAPSSNAGLASLSLSTGSLSPAFSTGVTNYTANVSNKTTTILATPAVSDPTATVAVNGITLLNGAGTGTIGLNVGNNIITTVVTAQDGTTKKTYTVTVIRAPSSNAVLANLFISSVYLNPVFSSGTTSYTSTVSNALTSITVKPVTGDATATVKVNGITVVSNTLSPPIALNVGSNTITIVVTAQDGTTTQTYTATVIRSPSSNAFLADVSLSSGILSPAFLTGLTHYTANVANSVSHITVTPTIADPTATVTVNGTTLASGTVSAYIPLNVGYNPVTIVVTAQDKTTQNIYSVNFIRAPSANAGLVGLKLSSGSLSPVFATGTISYSTSLGNATTSITVTPTTSDATATLTVNGAAVASGAASAPINLKVGSNTVTTIVTAQDKTIKDTYTVTAIRAPSSNAGLASLSLSTGSLSPAFSTGVTNYTANVSNKTTTILATPALSDPTATVAVNGITLLNGAGTGTIGLNVGNNIITTVVTAQDGTTKKTYTVTVIRAPSSNAALANLFISGVFTNPVFATGITSYIGNVTNAMTSLTVRPITSDATATVKVNGITVVSNTLSPPIALNVGSNTISIAVTAQDGKTTQTYTATVIRSPSSNAGLASLILSSGNLNTAFATATTNYSASAINITSTTVTATTSDPTATLTVNGAAVISGTASAGQPLNIGNNTILIVVTAQNGTYKQSYNVTVNLAPPSLIQSFATFNTNAPEANSDNKVIVHQAVSPNGDGINDVWLIEGIENYPINTVTILNSSGITIYNANGYNNSTKVFDGHSSINGRLQQPGTYFYFIEYSKNGKVERKSGYFILKFS